MKSVDSENSNVASEEYKNKVRDFLQSYKAHLIESCSRKGGLTQMASALKNARKMEDCEMQETHDEEVRNQVGTIEVTKGFPPVSSET